MLNCIEEKLFLHYTGICYELGLVYIWRYLMLGWIVTKPAQRPLQDRHSRSLECNITCMVHCMLHWIGKTLILLCQPTDLTPPTQWFNYFLQARGYFCFSSDQLIPWSSQRSRNVGLYAVVRLLVYKARVWLTNNVCRDWKNDEMRKIKLHSMKMGCRKIISGSRCSLVSTFRRMLIKYFGLVLRERFCRKLHATRN